MSETTELSVLRWDGLPYEAMQGVTRLQVSFFMPEPEYGSVMMARLQAWRGDTELVRILGPVPPKPDPALTRR